MLSDGFKLHSSSDKGVSRFKAAVVITSAHLHVEVSCLHPSFSSNKCHSTSWYSAAQLFFLSPMSKDLPQVTICLKPFDWLIQQRLSFPIFYSSNHTTGIGKASKYPTNCSSIWEWKEVNPTNWDFKSHHQNFMTNYLRTFESSPRRSFFSLVRSPCARSALITPAYASNSKKRKLFYQDKPLIFE